MGKTKATDGANTVGRMGKADGDDKTFNRMARIDRMGETHATEKTYTMGKADGEA